ncbi:MAG: cytochrome P450 [Pseudonocardia sp.]|uniref:cytochrome P450 family protein n=1 Tax=unclassified Pseudonocardia TaxID=2619320 RepID=UPI000A50643D|nr:MULTISPECIES: cytochrome P450 [unclassified Pseudonocardia]MBN9107715.1 cytochrome P450 [Pseudonocardia sp.]
MGVMTETTATTGTPELFDGAFWSDPYPAYAALRDAAPVRRIDLPGGPAWIVTRYDDVRAAFTDPRLAKDWRWTLPPEQRADAPATPMMILMDPPDHTRLRKLVSRPFTARRMAELRPRVEEIAADLLADLPAEGTVDLMAQYAFLLPVRVICELLGVPAEDRDEFSAWSATMVDDAPQDAKLAASQEMSAYLGQLAGRKAADPGDDLLSALVAVSEDDGDRLSGEELVAMGVLLLIAGHETTVNLIGNALLGLLTHPDQLELLRRDPGLGKGAVEEFLRWDSPVGNAPVRFTTEDVEIAGTTIPGGSVVMLGLGAANRDPARFPDADRLDVTRDASGHVAFGHGLHFCLGAQLARIEGDVALRALLDRYPSLTLAADPDDLVYRHSTLIRGLRELPVTLGS